MTGHDLRGRVAVVGVAESDLGQVAPGLTHFDLVGQATARALKDAGIAKSQVDGFFCASSYMPFATLDAAARVDAGERADMEAGMAKLFASEVCMEIALNAVRVHGGYGYSTEFDVER